MREVRLIAKAALCADLRQGHFRMPDQLFGLLNALITNPVLRGHARTALERA
jgi:hypothetical protein